MDIVFVPYVTIRSTKGTNLRLSDFDVPEELRCLNVAYNVALDVKQLQKKSSTDSVIGSLFEIGWYCDLQGG
jgi:hypothetical protein